MDEHDDSVDGLAEGDHTSGGAPWSVTDQVLLLLVAGGALALIGSAVAAVVRFVDGLDTYFAYGPVDPDGYTGGAEPEKLRLTDNLAATFVVLEAFALVTLVLMFAATAVLWVIRAESKSAEALSARVQWIPLAVQVLFASILVASVLAVAGAFMESTFSDSTYRITQISLNASSALALAAGALAGLLVVRTLRVDDDGA